MPAIKRFDQDEADIERNAYRERALKRLWCVVVMVVIVRHDCVEAERDLGHQAIQTDAQIVCSWFDDFALP